MGVSRTLDSRDRALLSVKGRGARVRTGALIAVTDSHRPCHRDNEAAARQGGSCRVHCHREGPAVRAPSDIAFVSLHHEVVFSCYRREWDTRAGPGLAALPHRSKRSSSVPARPGQKAEPVARPEPGPLSPWWKHRIPATHVPWKPECLGDCSRGLSASAREITEHLDFAIASANGLPRVRSAAPLPQRDRVRTPHAPTKPPAEMWASTTTSASAATGASFHPDGPPR